MTDFSLSQEQLFDICNMIAEVPPAPRNARYHAVVLALARGLNRSNTQENDAVWTCVEQRGFQPMLATWK